MRNLRKIMALLLMAVMVAGMLVVPGGNAQAAKKKKVQLNKKTVTLEVGKKVTLKLKNAPKKKTITWSSNEKKIASVSKRGVVTAKKVGKANITAKVNGKKYVCKVTVKEIQATTTEATTQQNTTTEAPKPENPTTPNTPTTPDNPTDSDKPATSDNSVLKNTKGKNADDVAVLSKIVPKYSNAFDVDLDSDQYEWDDNGRLIKIVWGSFTGTNIYRLQGRRNT